VKKQNRNRKKIQPSAMRQRWDNENDECRVDP
jgi:hypothetical protein